MQCSFRVTSKCRRRFLWSWSSESEAYLSNCTIHPIPAHIKTPPGIILQLTMSVQNSPYWRLKQRFVSPFPFDSRHNAQCDPYWKIQKSEWPFKSYVYHIYNPYWHTQRREWPLLSHLSNFTRSLQNNTYYIHKDKTAFQYNNTLQNRAYWQAQRRNDTLQNKAYWHTQRWNNFPV